MSSAALNHPAFPAVVGVLLLLAGQRLFWLFVGALGFAAGFEASTRLFGEEASGMVLGAALAVGIGGVFLAIFFHKLAIGIAGFVGGAYLAVRFFAEAPVVQSYSLAVGMTLMSGLAGAVVLVLMFDWALIVLSSFLGATMILQATPLPASPRPLLYLSVLVVLGIVVQANSRRRKRTAD